MNELMQNIVAKKIENHFNTHIHNQNDIVAFNFSTSALIISVTIKNSRH